MDGATPWPRLRWRDGGGEPGVREVPDETPVAVVYDASTYAVMMATPLDLEDFALGLSLTEGVVASIHDIREIEIVEGELGMEARMWLAPGQREALATRRRRLAGPTGCGLCGIDSLTEAARAPSPVTGELTLSPQEVMAALAALQPAQALGGRTRAVHAAGFWTPAASLEAVREDVGRHNALDKLAGALARAGRQGADGAVLLTSRVSVEMVQKTAVIGAPILIAVSAPTALAVRTAEAAGITLVAVARADGFEVFTHPERIVLTGP
ncbi:formate dehydrogenase accessory sulfurtransferase FdhD [Phenylobacterium sp.]|uniref:formate dehydrogenase accessory sulfurtransferase FdhD n=1 Tax=Phenylobacterium sp. TaxID=1871053 RepID=UPI0011F98E62|nr:formate dehydrogenase accessory sulfurtransferase FdhD [Phenylobacterium sp.]THD58112.1 MAG: formate dehydrogenase accessory sulfurtransferase FdhD [Phenylobacterium sp.]